DALQQACRVAKETLLGPQAPEAYTIHLPGSGSRLIGGGRQVELTAEEVRSCVLDGFFPHCDLQTRAAAQQAGFQEFGLPFASDAAMTRHLAAFLWDHRHAGRDDQEIAALGDRPAARPDWLLFNGGVMTSPRLCDRVVQVVGKWFAGQDGCDEQWQPRVLAGERLDLAVAVGAAYFGQVRRGAGVEIEAKLACSYYLQTSCDPPTAICIVPGSASPGEKFSLSELKLELAVGQPVQFPIVYSSTRLSDRVGQRVVIDEEHFSHLPPIRTVIEVARTRRQQSLPVYVEVELSQIGTLQIYCHACDSEHRWKLEFDVRGSTQTDHVGGEAVGNQAGILDDRSEQAARQVLLEVFSAEGKTKPARVMRVLADALGMPKSAWPPHLLRAMWATLIELQDGRRLSAAHEARWLNLLGYCLRPGYGLAADDWRVAQTWRLVHGKLAFPAISSRNESLILWRRIAGGFTAGQQLTVYQQIAGPLRSVLDPTRRAKGGSGVSPHELTELLRLVGALELLPAEEKTQLGNGLLNLLPLSKWSSSQAAMLWTLGRLGSRVPAYGPLNGVLDVAVVTRWLRALAASSLTDANLGLALMLCGRRVGDRYRDVSPETRELILDKLQRLGAPQHMQDLVQHGGQLQSEEASQILGEALPLGLTLR
ncbi:MAG: molecular chaperone DnaK, partial [Planctomycetales bacterium]|nr:molecular chaperone DnaK [Planctomycetales bacterium]